MPKEKLISFDIRADFGFFKKPDYNDGILLSYNMLHKPALLGILGAIAGLAGYKQKGILPQYYTELKDLQVSIEPLDHEKGNFAKTSVKYTNTVGYANMDGNLLVEETMLIKPGYRCYLLLDADKEIHRRLFDNLSNNQSEFVPYLGKNEYQAWISGEITEYQFAQYSPASEFILHSIFVKTGTVRNKVVKASVSPAFENIQGSFFYFERLPIDFDETLMQYRFNEFAYTDYALKSDSQIDELYLLTNDNKQTIIQLY